MVAGTVSQMVVSVVVFVILTDVVVVVVDFTVVEASVDGIHW